MPFSSWLSKQQQHLTNGKPAFKWGQRDPIFHTLVVVNSNKVTFSSPTASDTQYGLAWPQGHHTSANSKSHSEKSPSSLKDNYD